MTIQQFEMEMEVDRQMYYDDSSMFGIYALRPVQYTRELITNSFGNVSLQGVTRKLVQGERYEVKFEGTFSHQKYGEFYKIVSVAPDKLNTVEDQDKFLKAILTESQFNSLKEAYPNDLLVDMITGDKIDVAKTRGIKEKSLAKIKATVMENASISILIAKLSDLNLSTNAIDKLLAHFGTPDNVIEAIDEDIYNLCDVKMFGFLTVDKVAMERGDEPVNLKRVNACIHYLLKQDNNEGHTWTPRKEVISRTTEMLEIDSSIVEEFMTLLESSKKIYVNEERVAFSKVRMQEYEIYRHLKRIRDSYVAPRVENVEGKLKQVESYQRFAFTDEQREAIIQGSKHGVMVVNGAAGTGKTALVKGLIDSLGTSNYMTTALSGKAVSILSQRGIESSTIHRMLGRDPKTGGFIYGEDEPLPYSIIVPDEVSMIGVDLFLSIVSAVPNGSKLIIIGDSGQLSAIGAGDVLRDLLETEIFPTFELTQVHRQAAKSGILSLAKSIREGEQPFPFNSSGREVYGELKDQTVISYSDKTSIPYDVLEIARAYKERVSSPKDLVDFQVIVANRERGDLSVRSMNIELQQIFNDIKKPFLTRNNYNFRQGDKIIAKGNAYKQKVYNSIEDYKTSTDTFDLAGEEDMDIVEVDVFNGTMGHIISLDVESKMIFVQFEGIDGIVAMTQGDMDKIDLAYAATVHRLQGSGIKFCIFAIDYGAYKLLSKQLIYTALTRTIEKGVMLCENNALHAAISNDASKSRRTFLRDIMRNDS